MFHKNTVRPKMGKDHSLGIRLVPKQLAGWEREDRMVFFVSGSGNDSIHSDSEDVLVGIGRGCNTIWLQAFIVNFYSPKRKSINISHLSAISRKGR